jgi:hypothetical protein
MIITKKIKELNFSDQVYFIPSYQRGYRWEDKQVLELLEDIYEVYKTEQKSYCLQPLVVSAIESNKFEIIDGQQRLTTIFILLTRLKKFTEERFQLDFEVRENCKIFFENLESNTLDYSNPDFAHISNAYKVIDGWFKEKKEQRIDSNLEMNMFQTLLEKVEVIWYDVEEDDRKKLIKIFTRLNSGKILLTNAELIKALFLSNSNFNDQPNNVYATQLDISNKWNQIEYALQDDDFWNFIDNNQKDFHTRIDYIFQLIAKDAEIVIKEDLDVFRYYYSLYINSLQSKKYDFIFSNWSKIELYFTILRDWYHDHDYYHLVGLLIWDGTSPLTLIKEYQNSNKTEFKNILFKKIETSFCEVDLHKLFYNTGAKKDVERTLVFFNVLEALKSKNNKFPFKKLKLKEVKWSLEHIHPQNAEDIRQNDYLQWLDGHWNVISQLNSNGEFDDLLTQIDTLIINIKEVKPNQEQKLKFAELSNRILSVLTFKENKTEHKGRKSNIPFDILGNDHHIANMALLDTQKNSSLGNSAFSVKRKSIIDFELAGKFIPNATKNSFLKYYSDYPKHLIYWTLEDRDDYSAKIQNQIHFVKNFKAI